jgi:hypothetical protein
MNPSLERDDSRKLKNIGMEAYSDLWRGNSTHRDFMTATTIICRTRPPCQACLPRVNLKEQLESSTIPNEDAWPIDD